MTDSPLALDRIDPLCEAFEDALVAGQSPRIADFMKRSQPRDKLLLFEHLLELDVEYRQRLAEPISRDSYLQEYPLYFSLILRICRDRLRDDEDTPAGTSEVTRPSHDVTVPGNLQRLGDYRLLEEIGRGGMGVVWRAEQQSLSRIVAIKTIICAEFATEKDRQRFRSEAIAASTLDHPGIVPVYEVGEDRGQLFFAMGYVSGGSLADHVRDRSIDSQPAAELLRDITLAVAHSHDRGVIHRDLKPANILLDADGCPKVSDFGLARHLDGVSELTATGEILGTPAYMAPEQVARTPNGITVRSDIYSLGAILHRLICGHPPFQASNMADLLQQVVNQEPVRPSQYNDRIPRDLETICLKCLEKSPERRYDSAAELAQDLTRFMNLEPVHARPVRFTERSWRWCRRNPAISMSLATIALVLLVATGVSSFFAVLANERLQEVANANIGLLQAEQNARAAAQQADKSARLARLESQTAMETLESVLYEIQPALGQYPQLQEMRRSMLNVVAENFKKLSRDPSSDARFRRNTAMMLLHFADVQCQIGDNSGQTGGVTARALCTESLLVLERLLAESPEDRERLKDVAHAAEMQGNMLWQADVFVDAKQLFDRALALREQLVEESPHDPESILALANLETMWSDVEIRLGDRKVGRQRLEDSLQRARELAARYPQDARFHWACAEAGEQLGDWFFEYSTDLDSVEFYYHEYRDRMSKVIELVPNEPQYQMDYAAVFERLGDLHMRRKQYPEAAAAHEECLRINIPFGEAAPDNAEIKFELSIAWVKVGQVSLASGDLDRARVAWSESVNRCRNLAQTDPTNARVYRQLNSSLKGMATVHRQSSEFEQEKQCYEESMEFLNAFEKATGSSQFRSAVAMLKEQLDRSKSAN